MPVTTNSKSSKNDAYGTHSIKPSANKIVILSILKGPIPDSITVSKSLKKDFVNHLGIKKVEFK